GWYAYSPRPCEDQSTGCGHTAQGVASGITLTVDATVVRTSMRRKRLGLATLLLAAPVLMIGPPPAESAGAGPHRVHHPDALRSDFNADGFADLAVSVSREDVGSIVDAGAVRGL